MATGPAMRSAWASGRRSWSGYLSFAAIWTLTTAAGFAAIFVQLPILDKEPVFAIFNAAVSVSMVALGSYLALNQDESFCGWCFVVAGLSWLFIAADIYPGWGGWIAFVLGGGAPFFVPISWGVLRYGRPMLTHRSERAFPWLCAVFTSGFGAVWSLFDRPEWGGLPATDAWPALWPDQMVATVGSVFLSCGFLFIAGYFCWLLRRAYREASPTRRGLVRPLYVFGSAIAIGSSLIYTLGDTLLRQLSFHSLTVLIAVLALAMTTGLATAITGRQLLATQLVTTLPQLPGPENLSRYVRDVLRDESAKIYFWDAESERLIDLLGTTWPFDDDLHPERFSNWVYDGDGQRVALLTGSPLLQNDLTTVSSLSRLVSVLAENISLQAVLRRHIAQLRAAQTAEQIAFEQAREQFQRDLHDGVQQTIASARMDLEGVSDAIERPIRVGLVAQLDAKLCVALEQIRSLKQGGRPPELTFGLPSAIERTVIELRLNADSRVTSRDLGVLTVPVYYVVREALTNVHKHARATRVVVDVATDGHTITVSIADNGVGGAMCGPRGGIDGIRRRLEQLGGSLEIDSKLGTGTMMRASVPCVW